MLSGMRTNQEGIDLIKSFESCALTAYQDSGGVWTLGWGRARNINEGDTCTQEQADAWLLEDIADFEGLVINCIGLKICLTNNQFSALVSFCFNVGLGYKGQKDGFQVLKSGQPSTILRCIRAADFIDAASEFPKWDKINGVPSAGILRRRLAEQALFVKAETNPNDGKT